MHPRLLARDSCSGGSCPAVYDDDPDLLPDELAIVGNSTAPGLRSRIASKIAPNEELIVIKREIVERALRPAPRMVTAEEFQDQFGTFSYSAFRLEQLQHYVGLSRDEPWITHVKAARRWGKVHQRVHVVTEPLTPSMQQELTEGYEGNVSAGEDIRILPVAGEWPEDVPRADYWLFDSSRLYAMHYELDGTWRGAELVTDPDRIVYACRARDATLSRAIAWRAYIASRPELQRRLAQ